MTEPATDTRIWRCTNCQAIVTWDSRHAKAIKHTAAADFGQGPCEACHTQAMWRRSLPGRRDRPDD